MSVVLKKLNIKMMPNLSDNSSGFENNFCGGYFWNFTLLWHSEIPDFTPCFQKTVLSWVPLAILFLLSLFEVPSYFVQHNENSAIRFNLFNVTKIASTFLLISVNIAELVYFGFQDAKESENNLYPADYLFVVAFLVSHILCFTFLIISLKRGIQVSFLQFTFYLTSAISNSIIFRSSILQHRVSDAIFILISIQFGLTILMLFLNCFADHASGIRYQLLDNSENGSNEVSASVPSRLTLAWVTYLIYKGLKHTLDVSILWSLQPNLRASTLFQRYKARSVDRGKIPNVLPPLLKTFGYEYLPGIFLQLFLVGISVVTPQVLNLMIDHVSQNLLPEPLKDPYAFPWKGYLYAALLLLLSIIYNICDIQYDKKMLLLSMKVKTCLNSAIYRKSLYLSNTARKETTTGKIVNLMEQDVNFIMVCKRYFLNI